MKRNPLMNRILAGVIAVGMAFTAPASIVVDATETTSITSIENTSEKEDSNTSEASTADSVDSTEVSSDNSSTTESTTSEILDASGEVNVSTNDEGDVVITNTDETKYEYAVNDDVTVYVTTYGADVLPEDATLVVDEVEVTDAMTESVEETLEEEENVATLIAYDIRFETKDSDGNSIEVEPNGTVNVSIVSAIDSFTSGANVAHFDEDSETIEDMGAEVNEETEAVEFETDHFSTYLIYTTSGSNILSNCPYLTIASSETAYTSKGSGYNRPLQVRIYLDGSTTPLYSSNYPYNGGYYWFKESTSTLTITPVNTVITKIKSTEYYSGSTSYGGKVSSSSYSMDADYMLEYYSGSSSSAISLKIGIGKNDNNTCTEYLDIYLASTNTITYNANGGSFASGVSSTASVVNGSSTTLYDNAKVTKTGYGLLGWSTSSTATTPDTGYTAGATVTPTSSMTLYAVWGEQLTITDDVKNTGHLVANLVGYDGTITYKWYKKSGDGDYEEVTSIKSGDEYSLNQTDGSWVNLALDGGVKSSYSDTLTYKVVAYQNGTLIENLEATFESPYYKELQNGSFETPKNSSCTASDEHEAMHQFLYETHPEVVWKSTALGYHGSHHVEIEIISTDGSVTSESGWYKTTTTFTSQISSWYNWKYGETPYADDGVQFAEINCEANGELYQDVVTYKGAQLNYSFAHRARGSSSTTTEYDYMYLVIMPTAVAEKAEISNEEDLINYLQKFTGYESLKDFVNNSTDSSASNLSTLSGGVTIDIGDGNTIYVREVKSDDQSWHTYSGYYTATSYLSRFYYISGHTASNDSTVGNFIDDVWFSQDMPVANDGEYNLAITKTVTGLTTTQFETLRNNMSFTVSSSTSGAAFNGTTIAASDFTWSSTLNTDNTYTFYGVYNFASTKISDDASVTYTIVENNAAIEGYTITASSSIMTSAANATVNNNDVTLKATGSATFAFTNSYKINPTTISTDFSSYSKTAYEKSGSTDGRTFSVDLSALSYTRTITQTENTKPIDVILVIDTSGSMDFPSDLVETSATYDSIKNTTSGTYYYIENTSVATVYRVEYVKNFSNGNTNNTLSNYTGWIAIDASYDSTDSSEKKAAFAFTSSVFTSSSTGGANKQLYVQSSGKEGTTRLSYFKSAAKLLVDSLKNTDSKVSIVTFNASATTETFTVNGTSQNYYTVGSSYSALTTKIDGLTTSGGTRPDYGLSNAYDLLSSDTYKNDTVDKYVIFLTDGVPNRNGKTTVSDSDNTQIADEALNYATSIKNLGATIYTIGVDTSFITSSSSAKTELDKVLNQCCSSPASTYATTTESNNLEETFVKLTTEISNTSVEYTYTNPGTVTDIIDSRFYLIDDDGNAYTDFPESGSTTIEGTVKVGGYDAIVILNSDGTTLVAWYNQTLGSGDTTPTAWNAVFTIHAKDDFMGGNIISTNVYSDSINDTLYHSGVQPGNGTFVDFEQPSVNVRLLDFTLENDETTIFLNEELAGGDLIADYLANTANSSVTSLLKELNESDLESLANGDAVTVDYAYPGTTDVVGDITYELVAIPSEEKATNVGDDVYTYTIKLTYKAKDYTSRDTGDYAVSSDVVRPLVASTTNTKSGGDVLVITGDSANGIKTTTGNYYINVIDASLYIYKAIKENGVDIFKNGAEYKIEVSEGKDGYLLSDGERVDELTATSLNISQGTLEGQMCFASLGLGTYTLTETVAPDGCLLKDTTYKITISKDEDGNYDVVMVNNDTNETVSTETISKTVVDSYNNAATAPSSYTVDVFKVSNNTDAKAVVYDTKIYELPHTGGVGIYLFMISGMLFMMAGVLLIYITRRKNLI